MKRIAFCLLFGMATTIGFVGCAEKSSTTVEKTVETPGGETTVKQETTVTKEGDHKEGDAAPAPANP